jgi:TolA-binding protein
MAPIDDLLIKRRRGALTAAEGRRLDTARRAAPEYDLALLAHDVFEADGSSQPDDAERLRRLVEGVERRMPRLPRASGRWRTLLRRLAPPLFVAGAAAASIGELTRPEPSAPLPSATPPLPTPSIRVGSAQPSAASPVASPAPPPPPLRPEAAKPEAAKPEIAPIARPIAPARTPPASPGSITSNPESAQSLFRRANRLRPVDWPAAAALYAEVVRRHPASNEAGVSEVALGKWSLAQGRSGDALEWFRAHLRRPPSALMAEALFGEASALESLGSHTEARAPWRQLLERYPASPYADVARQRLEP